jgi:hypothetical protein
VADGYSAKEQAKAWLRSGSPAVPEELWSTLEPLVAGEVLGVDRGPRLSLRGPDAGAD